MNSLWIGVNVASLPELVLILISKFVLSEYVLVNRGTGYKPLDVSKIITDKENQSTQNSTNDQAVNTKSENQYLDENLGFWDKQDALDASIDPKVLKREQAKKLDQLHHRR
ncbi:MAG: hypothetical protein HYS80_02755 [Candidatus Aenigmarchaeota archaeon]|nr:hypothetical protein [Candidatus Aenigmarchaeota archaeon]